MSALSAVNRRRLLLGLASASATGAAILAAGTTVGAAVVDIANGSEPIESALLALADELAPAEAEMIAANTAFDGVVRKWWWKWPIAPDAIVKPYRDDHARERGLDGSFIGPDGRRDYEKARPLFSAKSLALEIASIDRAMRQHRPKHPLTIERVLALEAERAMLTDALDLAQAYEAETARVLEASGYALAKTRRDSARDVLLDVVGRIMAQPAHSMAGLVIQAEALTAWANAPYHAIEAKGWEWPQQLAASLLRIAKDTPAQHA